MHRLQDLIRLHRQGQGSRVIARQLRMGRDTIRHYLRALKEAELLDGARDAIPELEVLQRALASRLPPRPPPQQEFSIEAWRELIEAMHGRRAGPRSIFDRLRLGPDSCAPRGRDRTRRSRWLGARRSGRSRSDRVGRYPISISLIRPIRTMSSAAVTTPSSNMARTCSNVSSSKTCP